MGESEDPWEDEVEEEEEVTIEATTKTKTKYSAAIEYRLTKQNARRWSF